MVIEVHILASDEEAILPFTLRHYETFASRIVLHDLGSTDRTVEIASAAGAEIRPSPTHEFDDRLNQRIKNTAWNGTDADWVIMADADELIYFPMGWAPTLDAYGRAGEHVLKPYGYEMESPTFPEGGGQIYDYVKFGGRDDKWYAKPILFSPKRVKSLIFGTGAHEVSGVLQNGRAFKNPTVFSSPPCYLLHCHHLGSIERIAALYDANRSRHSAANKQNKWGLQCDGTTHAKEKRAAIMAKRERVIA